MLCRVRNKSNNVAERRFGNGHNTMQSSSSVEGFGEEDMIEKINNSYDHHGYAGGSEVLDGLEYFDHFQTGSSSNHSNPPGMSDLQINIMGGSVKEALENIKRVLLFEPLHEQATTTPKTRFSSLMESRWI